MRSRPPRDAGWRGRWDPELYGSVLGVENASLPAREAPGVRGSRRRSSSGTPAGPLRAGLTAGTRTHAGTRSAQCPGRPGPGGEPHSLTLTGTDCASFSAPPAPFPLCSGPLLRLMLLGPPSQTLPAQPLASARPQGAHLPRTRRFHSGSGSGSGSLSHHRKEPSRASDFRAAQGRKAEVRCLTGAGSRKVSV